MVYGGIGPEGIGAYDAATDTIKVSGSVSAGGSASAAAADAESNATTMSAQRTRPSGFNGTTWDRLRAGITAIGSAFTGFLNTLPTAIFHTAPTVRTDGQGGPLEADAAGNLQVNLSTRLAGENITADRMAVEGEWTYATITTATTTVIKSGAGVLHSITVCKAVATGVIDAYDNTAGSGAKIIPAITYGASLLSDPPLGGQPLDAQFSLGLTIVTSAATFLVVAYR